MPEWSDKCLSVEITLFFFLKEDIIFNGWEAMERFGSWKVNLSDEY